MTSAIWQQCLNRLEAEIPAEDFNTWIRVLHAVDEQSGLRLLAPNRFVVDWVNQRFRGRIEQILVDPTIGGPGARLKIEIGSVDFGGGNNGAHGAAASQDAGGNGAVRRNPGQAAGRSGNRPRNGTGSQNSATGRSASRDYGMPLGGLDPGFTFDAFVEGKSNQFARAMAMQVGDHPGRLDENPLLIYGGVGLGKTHLMHALGHGIVHKNPSAKIVYLHSERFVADMVKALQHNAIDVFKRHFRSVDALLIDDIQFFAGKERSQEEFFHTFNALLEKRQQVVITCDRYPKEVEGLEERLKSRLGWGLSVAIEPPDMETRAAILQKKSGIMGIELPDNVAFFIAQRIHSNVRELEGALRRVVATARFTGRPIDMDFCKEALRDLLALQDKLISIENIQKTVAEYYKIRVADLHSKRRSRSITRPRQLAMALAKELTNHSLPEIGDAFGGRDHTTVLHACKKITELREDDPRISEDYSNLLRTLST